MRAGEGGGCSRRNKSRLHKRSSGPLANGPASWHSGYPHVFLVYRVWVGGGRVRLKFDLGWSHNFLVVVQDPVLCATTMPNPKENVYVIAKGNTWIGELESQSSCSRLCSLDQADFSRRIRETKGATVFWQVLMRSPTSMARHCPESTPSL